jgi:integrase
MPLLVCRATGVPLEAATFWLTSERRPLGTQANTLEQELRHLMVLYLWGDARGIDPIQRLKSPAFLTLAEMNDLDRFCRKRVEQAVAEVGARSEDRRYVVALAARRQKNPTKESGRMQVRNRMASIHSFMDHISCDHLSRLAPGTESHHIYQSCRRDMLEKWAARYRSLDVANGQAPKRGLDQAALERLREVIRPDHPENPWQLDVQYRNGLIVLTLWALGLRRGELLALETKDLKFAADRAFVTIVRRPDNPLDTRRPRPAVKTLGRELVIDQPLADLMRAYIMEHRRLHQGARKHPFVFVSSVDGMPLSMSSLNKLFQALRARVPDLPDDLSPHIMRHSWNDAFSAASDRANPHRTDIEQTHEERMRSYLMGWSRDSRMAAKYSVRWTADAANKQLLSLQQNQIILTGPPPELPES